MLYHANHGNPVGSIKSGSFYRSPITGCQTSLSYDNRRIPVYYSARTFKRPTHCLTTTYTSRIPGQRRLDLYFLSREILPAGNQEKHVLRINYTFWESRGLAVTVTYMKCLAIRSTILSNHHHFTNRQK